MEKDNVERIKEYGRRWWMNGFEKMAENKNI